MVPGDVVELKSEYWSKAVKTLPKPVSDKKMRVREVRFSAKAVDQGPDADHGLQNTLYDDVEGDIVFAQKTTNISHCRLICRHLSPLYRRKNC